MWDNRRGNVRSLRLHDHAAHRGLAGRYPGNSPAKRSRVVAGNAGRGDQGHRHHHARRKAGAVQDYGFVRKRARRTDCDAVPAGGAEGVLRAVHRKARPRGCDSRAGDASGAVRGVLRHRRRDCFASDGRSGVRLADFPPGGSFPDGGEHSRRGTVGRGERADLPDASGAARDVGGKRGVVLGGADGHGDCPFGGGVRGVRGACAESGGAGGGVRRGAAGGCLLGLHQKPDSGANEGEAGARGHLRKGGDASVPVFSYVRGHTASVGMAVFAGRVREGCGDGVRWNVIFEGGRDSSLFGWGEREQKFGTCGLYAPLFCQASPSRHILAEGRSLPR